MRLAFILMTATLMTTSGAYAGSQSSNSSSNSSSNNGVVRERVVESYCEDGNCERTVSRRVYRDDRKNARDDRRPRRYSRDDDDD